MMLSMHLNDIGNVPSQHPWNYEFHNNQGPFCLICVPLPIPPLPTGTLWVNSNCARTVMIQRSRKIRIGH